MPVPHHSFWDSLLLDAPPRDFDRPLPLMGKLGRRIRARRRGVGYALGRSFQQFRSVSRINLCSPRLRVLLRRNWLSMLLALLYLGVFGFLVVLMFHSRSIYAIAAWAIYCIGTFIYGSVRKVELMAWPSIAMRLRRQALLYSSNRFRRLHPESGQDQSPDQIAFYIAQRREHWLNRLNTLGFAERNTIAYREHWWLAFLPFVVLIPITISTTNIYRLGPLIIPTLFVFYALLFGAPTPFARYRLKRFRSTLTSYTCPDCGYPLVDFIVGHYRGAPVQGLGPRVCIECGTPWPLLPPPISRAKPKRSLFTRSIFSRRSNASTAPPRGAIAPHSSPSSSHPPTA